MRTRLPGSRVAGRSVPRPRWCSPSPWKRLPAAESGVPFTAERGPWWRGRQAAGPYRSRKGGTMADDSSLRAVGWARSLPLSSRTKAARDWTRAHLATLGWQDDAPETVDAVLLTVS